MGMLSEHDIKWMESTVQEVIHSWMNKITIYSRLPLEEQPNYNHLMHEFTGDYYCTKTEIDAERKDIVNNMINDPGIDTLDFGRSNDGTILYAIPNIIKVKNDDGEEEVVQYKPSLHDLVTNGDGTVYFIRNIRDRIGETLITVKRFSGNTPVISEIEDEDGELKITVRDYDWSVVDG